MKPMKWIEPEFSKERVKKAGKSILSANVGSDEFKEAVPILCIPRNLDSHSSRNWTVIPRESGHPVQ
jgi:hypothetical protein